MTGEMGWAAPEEEERERRNWAAGPIRFLPFFL
jgi:hypothetical protein